ncbi:putative processing peptidase [Helianthus annuus]|nr:putative processing peptidase [Helianthus annuus]
MNTLHRSHLDLNTPCPVSSIYTKIPQTPTSITCYKHPFSCFSVTRYRITRSRCKGLPVAKALPKTKVTKTNPQVGNGELVESNRKLVDSIARGLIGVVAAVSVCLDSPAMAESLTIAFPASRTHEVNAVQRTLVETWGLIRETFVDPTFNHQDWDSKLQQTMVEMLPLRTADAAYSKIKGMLSTLGDPFTRIISPKEYQSFRIGSDGNVQGVGLFVNTEPKTGHLVVLSCVEGSPADRAGIHVGDELVEINGIIIAVTSNPHSGSGEG